MASWDTQGNGCLGESGATGRKVAQAQPWVLSPRAGPGSYSRLRPSAPCPGPSTAVKWDASLKKRLGGESCCSHGTRLHQWGLLCVEVGCRRWESFTFDGAPATGRIGEQCLLAPPNGAAPEALQGVREGQ